MAVALMPRSVRRDPDAALTLLYDRHAAALLSFARSYVGDTAAAEDVVQQTFLSAHRTLAGGAQLEQPRAWLFHVARNNALTVLRERGGLRAADASLTEELEARASEVTEQVEEREELRSVVADIVALPADQRAALTLFELGDLSQSEIATAIGVEKTKVKALVFQARSALVDQRAARDVACATVREKLATLTGGARNQRLIRNHLRQCAACTAYRDELRDRRRKLALLLPIPLMPGLREAVLGKGAAAVAAGHAGAAAWWLGGKAHWLVVGGSTTAAAGVLLTVAMSGGADHDRPEVAATATPRPALAAATVPAPRARPMAPQPRAGRRQSRARTSPRKVVAAPPAQRPRLRVKGERVPERTRHAPVSPERPAPSLTPAPSPSPAPSAPASTPEPTSAPPTAVVTPEPTSSPPVAPTPSPAPPSSEPPENVWPPGHRDKGDGHPNHPPHP